MKRLLVMRGIDGMSNMSISKYALEYAEYDIFPIVVIDNYYNFKYYNRNIGYKSKWINYQIDIVSKFDQGEIRGIPYDEAPIFYDDDRIILIETNNHKDYAAHRILGDTLLKSVTSQYRFISLNAGEKADCILVNGGLEQIDSGELYK